MHLDENITSSGQLVWQDCWLSSQGCYIVPCNVDTRRQEIKMRDNREGGASQVWDMYVSAAWAWRENLTAQGNVCASSWKGGDFPLKNQTTEKPSCNRGDWWIEGIFFCLIHLCIFDYFYHGGLTYFLLACLDIAKQGEVTDFLFSFPTDEVKCRTPNAHLQFFTAKSVPEIAYWEIFLHTSVVDVFFFTPQKWNKIHFLKEKSVHVPDAAGGNVRRKGRSPGRVWLAS